MGAKKKEEQTAEMVRWGAIPSWISVLGRPKLSRRGEIRDLSGEFAKISAHLVTLFRKPYFLDIVKVWGPRNVDADIFERSSIIWLEIKKKIA